MRKKSKKQELLDRCEQLEKANTYLLKMILDNPETAAIWRKNQLNATTGAYYVRALRDQFFLKCPTWSKLLDGDPWTYDHIPIPGNPGRR
jgi:hypothetical protein